MKIQKDPRWLPGLILGMGLAGLVLRFLLYKLALDEKGLLTPNHPLELILWCLALAALVVALVFTGKEPKPKRDERLEALGELMGAVGIAIMVPGSLTNASSVLDGLHLGLGLVAAVALSYGAILRWQGKPAPMLCCAAACVFFALHLVCRYRGWSAHPQLQDYFFPLMGAMAGMIFGYLRCDAGRAKLRRLVGLLGCFCCLTALSSASDPTLYLGCSIWMITNLHAPGEIV